MPTTPKVSEDNCATEAPALRPAYTPGRLSYLRPNEVFVFGSNLSGHHGGGAARTAVERFGAIWGQGVGMQGQSYGIPTMHGGVDAIKPYVDEFIAYARAHTDKLFYVTRIGCGIAGFRDEEMAPLFADAVGMENIILPRSFADVLAVQPVRSEPTSVKE